MADILILVQSPPVLATEINHGVIEGQLVNGTESGSSVANQEIALHISLNGTELDSVITRTDVEGHFVFEDLATEPVYSYRVILTFQQAEYTSDWLSFDVDESSKVIEVMVYDATTSDESIRVVLSHTIIYVEEDSLLITEYFLFVNESELNYIGSEEVAPGIKETLKFSLPEGVAELQFTHGLMEGHIYNKDDGFVDTMPVLPGGKEVVYVYKLNYGPGTYEFSRGENYPTTNYNFLIQGEDITVTSAQLTTEEPMVIEGTLFTHLSGTDLAPGDTLVTRLSGLPMANNQRTMITIIWVVLVLGALLGGFGIFRFLKRRRRQPVTGDISHDRQRLLVGLAQLDDDLESGNIHEEDYMRLRADKKSQLTVLTQEQEESDDNK